MKEKDQDFFRERKSSRWDKGKVKGMLIKVRSSMYDIP
jgi:hypothetical protein